MSQAIYFDIDRCIGCYACQAACKQENDLAPHTLEKALEQTSPVWRRVMEVEQGKYGQETVSYISLSCMHCADAPCVIACPTGALTRESDGSRVVVNQSKCIGCKMCLLACPFGVPQYGEDELMQKCNLCLSRLQEGASEPACVAACPAKALRYGDTAELSKNEQNKVASRLVLATGNKYAAGI